MGKAVQNAGMIEHRKMVSRRLSVTIETLRRLRGLEQREIAEVIGVLPSSLTPLMKGTHEWKAGQLPGIAELLDVPLGMLYEPPLDALQALGLPADVAQAFLDNALTAEQIALTSRYADRQRDVHFLVAS